MDDSNKTNDNSKKWRPLILIVFVLGLGIGYVFDWHTNRNPENSVESVYSPDSDDYDYDHDANVVQSVESSTNHDLW